MSEAPQRSANDVERSSPTDRRGTRPTLDPRAWVVAGSGLVTLAVIVEFVADPSVALETDVWHPSVGQVTWTASIGVGTGLSLLGLQRMAVDDPPDSDPTDPERGLVGESRWLGPALALLTIAAAWLVLVALVASPGAVNGAAREDRIVEWLAALAAAVAAGAAVVCVRRTSGPLRWALVVCAAGMLWVALEEVSYLQRVIGYGTPDALASVNDQQEANLHNLATDMFQNLYYAGVAILATVVPFVHRATWRHWSPTLTAFVPTRLVTGLAIASIVFTYASTSYPAHHLSWWLALWFIALWGPAPPVWRLAFATLVVGGTLVVAATAHELARDWALSEYRELFAATALAAWLIDAASTINPAPTASDRVTAGAAAR